MVAALNEILWHIACELNAAARELEARGGAEVAAASLRAAAEQVCGGHGHVEDAVALLDPAEEG
jgi:hypothetical protein